MIDYLELLLQFLVLIVTIVDLVYRITHKKQPPPAKGNGYFLN